MTAAKASFERSAIFANIDVGIAIGIVIGVYIDTDVVIRGKIKQKTGKGGRSNIQDIKSDINVKKQARKAKREQRKLKRNINKHIE